MARSLQIFDGTDVWSSLANLNNDEIVEAAGGMARFTSQSGRSLLLHELLVNPHDTQILVQNAAAQKDNEGTPAHCCIIVLFRTSVNLLKFR